MKLVEKIFRSLSDSFFPGLVLLVGIVPGIVEEFMFRGYLQSRLLKRWHPAAAIGLSAILFSVAHLDWMHVLGVLPLGVWLGVIAWRSGSIWPAVLGHAANNTFAVLELKFGAAAILAILLVVATVVMVYFVFRRTFTTVVDSVGYIEIRHAFHAMALALVIFLAFLGNSYLAVLLLLPPAYFWTAMRARRTTQDRVL
ncbi:MAG: CPBP family intramembrane metalloprotease, partial [Planctomycetia bacterium]|nr:CPBP family intramembrane metalloprotease [Planctomycetia bacterium]